MGVKKLSPFQARSVHLAKNRFNIWEGAVRASKSVSCNLSWIKFVINVIKEGESEDDNPLLMMGKTERTLKRNVINPMTAMLGHNRCKFNSGEGELRLFGRRVYVAGANDKLALSKIAGLTLRGAYGDEVSLWPEDTWKMLGTRLSLDDSRFYGTSNPDSPNHYLKVGHLNSRKCYFDSTKGLIKFPPEQSIDLAQFHFCLDDNVFLSETFKNNLRKEYKGLWKLRYIDGLWVIAEGAIYDMFDPARHVSTKERLSLYPHIIGIDYGTTNPFVAVAIEIRPEGLHQFAELYIDKPLTDSELAISFERWLTDNEINPGWICIDPSAASFKRELHKRGIRHLHSANNDVKDGLRTCASLYATDRFSMAPCCEHTRNEVTGYCWDGEASKKGEDKPIKQNDHCMDGKRYAIKTTESIWKNKIGVMV